MKRFGILVLALFVSSSFSLEDKYLKTPYISSDNSPDINIKKVIKIGDTFEANRYKTGYFLVSSKPLTEVKKEVILNTNLYVFGSEEDAVYTDSFADNFLITVGGKVNKRICIPEWRGHVCIRKKDAKLSAEEIQFVELKRTTDRFAKRVNRRPKKLNLEEAGLKFILDTVQTDTLSFKINRIDSKSIELIHLITSPNALRVFFEDKRYLSLESLEPQLFAYFDTGNVAYLFKNLGNNQYIIEQAPMKDLNMSELNSKFAQREEELSIHWQGKDYLDELIVRCKNFNYKSEGDISACIQKETFNDKQLALLKEQNNIMQNQAQLNQSQPRGSIFLESFLAGLTSSAISNAIQSSMQTPQTIYKPRPQPVPLLKP